MPRAKFQYSIRSLLLLTLFVAVLCSLGACTSWLASVAVAVTIVIGGIAGRIVAGTRLGFIQGALFAIQFVVIAVIVGLVDQAPIPILQREASWGLSDLYFGVAALVGGIVGGFTVRPRPRQ